MALAINIMLVDGEDYSGNPIQTKDVDCLINNVPIPEHYSYDPTVPNGTIEAEVQADLTSKGYTW